MKKILIIEDDLTTMMLYSELFDNDGYEIIKCFNGNEAFKKIKSSRPNVILLDLHMPLVDGLQVYNMLKSDNEVNNIPIIVVTADSGAKNKYSNMNVEWEFKPINRLSLFEKIRSITNSTSTKQNY